MKGLGCPMRYLTLSILCGFLAIGATCRSSTRSPDADGPAAGDTSPGADGTSATQREAATAVAETSHDFPVMPGMTHACGQSVLSADGTEILWDIFATTASPEDVAAYYKQQLGTAGLEESDGEWTWRAPPGQEQPDRVLGISSASAWHPDCPGLPADAATLGNFSNMLRR
ncbi:MAG: hypothetical protein HY905_04950 [Deltaproteobacteria bacterium]|nr:hypothetical protein [Deltaproteobacteria bacterium]